MAIAGSVAVSRKSEIYLQDKQFSVCAHFKLVLGPGHTCMHCRKLHKSPLCSWIACIPSKKLTPLWVAVQTRVFLHRESAVNTGEIGSRFPPSLTAQSFPMIRRSPHNRTSRGVGSENNLSHCYYYCQSVSGLLKLKIESGLPSRSRQSTALCAVSGLLSRHLLQPYRRSLKIAWDFY